MKKIYLILFLLFLIVFMCGCKSTQIETEEWKIGNEVQPPQGCIDLRKENPNANC